MFYDRLISLCDQHNITVTMLLKELGLSTSKATSWKYGAIPKGNTIAQISDYFHVTTDYLLSSEDIKKEKPVTGEDNELSDMKKLLHERLSKIDDSVIPEVLRYAEYLVSQRSK